MNATNLSIRSILASDLSFTLIDDSLEAMCLGIRLRILVVEDKLIEIARSWQSL